jgi:hypothetical protein
MRKTLALAIILCLPGIVFATDKPLNNSVICLATLAHWNAWEGKHKGGQSPFGKYIGNSETIEKFKSHDGKYIYYCDLKAERVHTASAPTALKTLPEFNYARTDYQHYYTVQADNLTITTKYPDGTKDEQKFSIKQLKMKL